MESRVPAVPGLSPAQAWLVVLTAMVVLYGVTMENGAVLADGARYLHEAFHDGRHFMGFPCH
ncbi:MAG: CbtB-domain containing protein [Actinomycetota bacterium]|nr:CbtB-domain containing protein [Actinomycetota bacterium]